MSWIWVQQTCPGRQAEPFLTLSLTLSPPHKVPLCLPVSPGPPASLSLFLFVLFILHLIHCPDSVLAILHPALCPRRLTPEDCMAWVPRVGFCGQEVLAEIAGREE